MSVAFVILGVIALIWFEGLRKPAELTIKFTNHKYFTAGIYPPPAFGFGYTTVNHDGLHHVVWVGPISFAYGEQGAGLERTSQ